MFARTASRRFLQSLHQKTRYTPILLQSRNFSELPYHLVVGMPALSPTMDAGTLRSWKVKEGGSYSAGDTIAEIETDKATIDFEAQDDAFVAKILVPEGTTDVAVGTPIMVTVEEEEYLGAFKDFVPQVEEEPKAVEEPEPVTPPVAAAAAVPPSPPPAAPAAPPPATAVTHPSPAVTAPPTTPADVAAAAMTMSPVWGEHIKVSSPIIKTLSNSQKRYLELYGSTGQVPV